MKKVLKKSIKVLVFTVIGALVGLGYYYLFGCSDGSCTITSNPWSTMAYTGLIGALLSVLFEKGCQECNT